MNREEILSHVDHTLLKPEATWPQIQTLCDEAIANHTASVCINTCYVKQAVEYMAGRIPVCCVVGFPLGAMDTASKAFEAKTAIENGAAEVDMVINIGRLKNGEYDAVREDIRAVKQAVGDKVLKVIIETCLLTDDEKRKMCDIVCEAGADYIKTSTGFSTAGANFHDVELMVKGVHGRCKVKAAGGISTVEDMEKFLALGADRLGTSRAVKILNGEQAKGYLVFCKKYFGKALGLAELQRMISQGLLHKLLCSGLFYARALPAGSGRVYNTDRSCIKQEAVCLMG